MNVWRKKYAQGEVIVLRYADDIILGFQYQTDADRFLENLRERLAMFGVLIALIVALPIRDYLAQRRLHPASTWGAFLILLSFPTRVAIGNSGVWHVLVSRIISPS